MTESAIPHKPLTIEEYLKLEQESVLRHEYVGGAIYSGQAVLLPPFASRRRETVRAVWSKHRREALGVVVLSPLPYVLVLMALVFTPVSYVGPAREISILIGIVMGTRLLAEGYGWRRLVAASVMVVGMIGLAVA